MFRRVLSFSGAAVLTFSLLAPSVASAAVRPLDPPTYGYHTIAKVNCDVPGLYRYATYGFNGTQYAPNAYYYYFAGISAGGPAAAPASKRSPEVAPAASGHPVQIHTDGYGNWISKTNTSGPFAPGRVYASISIYTSASATQLVGSATSSCVISW